MINVFKMLIKFLYFSYLKRSFPITKINFQIIRYLMVIIIRIKTETFLFLFFKKYQKIKKILSNSNIETKLEWIFIKKKFFTEFFLFIFIF